MDRKLVLSFYSRMRFIMNLLPLLRISSASAPHFSRSLTILGAGNEGALNLNDLELKHNYSVGKSAAHSVTMTDFMVEEFACREPGTSFIHSFPGSVKTGITREMPLWARVPAKILMLLMKPVLVSLEETGQRQLYMSTSGLYPPEKPFDAAPLAIGVPVLSGARVAKGSNGKGGSGAYLLNWNNEVTGKERLLTEYRENGVAQIVWDHTIEILDRVENINQKRA